MTPDWHARTAAVARHPRLQGLGRDAAEQRRIEALARDLAAWLAGAPREDLGALARVVTAVAGRSFRETRTLCLGLPLLAIEAAARATEVLWPLLRDPRPPEPPPPPAPAASGPAGQGGAGGVGADDGDAGGAGEGEGSGEAEEQDAEPGEDGEPSEPAPEVDPREVLRALADGAGDDDPELEALARALAGADDPGAAAAERLAPVGDPAWEGARASEQLARTLESLVPGLGWGAAPGHLHETLTQRMDQLVALLERLPDLRRIAERLGRAEAEEAREGTREGGSEEVTGVRLSGDVAGALPAELALLSDPETEDLFYLRLAERQLVALELAGAGTEGVALPEARGPVLACIDTSGSMAGAPELVAKALVLAVCRRVLPQGRAVHLLLFGARGEHRELRLRRGRGGLEELLDFLAMGFEGGTDFDTPLARALELLDERELATADLLVVTDGFARAAPEVVRAVAEARQTRGVRVWSVVIGAGDLRGVEPFSDEVWQVGTDAGGSVGLVRRLG